MLDALGADYARVLDLYAGTGALGIEALSRGDGTADFVESDGATAAIITENLKRDGVRQRGERAPLDSGARDRAPFRPVTPSSSPIRRITMRARWPRCALVAGSALVDERTVLVLEHHRKAETPDTLGPLRLYRTSRARRHGRRDLRRGGRCVTLAMFPGRFDPVTNGHRDIARRAAKHVRQRDRRRGGSASRTTSSPPRSACELLREALRGLQATSR